MVKLTKKWISLCLALMLLLSCTFALATEGTPTTEATAKADWTVLMYLCGTDLESQNSMATYNLEEIAKTTPTDSVNMLIQTGGTRQWHAKENLGLDIATDKLQRYHFGTKGYALVDEQPLASMSAGSTLTDFVKWGAAAYPAEKYMLVLWDHGGGSSAGLILDELYNSSIMNLEDLGRALGDAGVHFENIVTDTCLMASLETAQAIAPYANYFVASEEVVPGQGSAYQSWLQYLYDTPSCKGDRFGKVFCDVTQQKYAELGDATSNMLTYSVIDLSKIEAVTVAFNKMFLEIGKMLEDPLHFQTFSYFTRNTEHYYLPTMVDLYDMASRARNTAMTNETANAVQEAVSNAVLYSIRGDGRTYSNGLSFYYEPTAPSSTLDHYARNSNNPAYLAFLDAANMDWTAPAWVYEKTERLPDIKREDYIVESETSVTESGNYQAQITNAKSSVVAVDSVLYKYNKDNNAWLLLGHNFDVDGDFENGIFTDRFTGMWPTLGGVLCQINVLEETVTHTLYGIPCLLDAGDEGQKQVTLRAGYVYDVPLDQSMQTSANNTATDSAPADSAVADNAATVEPTEQATAEDATAAVPADPYSGAYALYGVWSEYDSSVNLPSRDIADLKQFNGFTLQPLLNAVTLSGQKMGYVPSGKVTISNTLDIVNQPLPKGDYAYAFIITDSFGKKHETAPAVIHWNGKTAVFEAMK